MTRLHFPELELQDKLTNELSIQSQARVQVLGTIPCAEHQFPVVAFEFGHALPPEAPTLLIVGGVHGLERIGTQVVLAILQNFAQYLQWDPFSRSLLEMIRVVFVPMLNPAGVYLQRRSNGNGVDLMRNAPHDSEVTEPRWKIFRGHRLSPRLPWYRGEKNAPLELETQILFNLVREKLARSRFLLSVDVHSGYGAVDRIWFPYARTHTPFPNVAEAYALKQLLDQTLRHHVYVMEPNSAQYTLHGDLWDHLYDQHRADHPGSLFLPLTLEMGSWNWVKKNPLQLFSALGLFHPMKPHRVRRVLRRHAPFFDFLMRATRSWERWAPQRT